MSIGLKQIG